MVISNYQFVSSSFKFYHVGGYALRKPKEVANCNKNANYSLERPGMKLSDTSS